MRDFPINDELIHYGIEGQKWGVRRYQNEDGTLTPAGKERYSRSKKIGQGIKNVSNLYGKHVVNTIKKNHPWLMSDEELATTLARMTMEQKVRNIRKDERSSRFVNKVMKDTGDILVSNIKDFNREFAKNAGKGLGVALFGSGSSKKDKKNNNNNDNNDNKKRNRRDAMLDTLDLHG